MYSSFYLLFFFFFSLFRVGRFFLFLFLCCLCCFFLSFRTVFFSVFFFFSSRRRHTRCSRDWEFRRVLFRSSKDAQRGEMVSPVSAGGGFTRTGIATIVDMSSLEIEVDVNESYIARVKAGQAVTAEIGRGSWRGRGENLGVAVLFKKKKEKM